VAVRLEQLAGEAKYIPKTKKARKGLFIYQPYRYL